MNLASLLEGPAIVSHLGQTFHFRGGLTLTPLRDLFPLIGDSFDALDQRALDTTVVLTGTPVGKWTAAQIAALWRTAALPKGALVTPRYDVDSINTTSDVITLLETAGQTAPRSTCPVRMVVEPGGTLPAAITAGTTYYWGPSGKLYDTAAHAATDDGTGKVDFADDGTGDLYIIEQEELVIDAVTANRRITFHNSAVITPPAVVLSAVETLLGQVAFGCFRKENAAWADANSLYTIAKVALSDTPPDAADIPTQEYSCVFGAAPFDSFKARGPITITPTLETVAIQTDGRGTLGMKVGGRGISATLAPQGFSHSQLLELLGLQGGTVARGKSAIRGDLVISGTGVHCTLYNGSPRQLPQTFQTTGPLAGALEIVGAQESDGSLFRFATAAP
jgi:hypothetical protein